MAFCKKCGTKLDEDAVFCPECGTPVSSAKKDEPAQTSESKLQTLNPKQRRTSPSGTTLNAENLYGRFNLEKLPEGHIIDDRYEIIRKLGQGSFGAVYLVYDSHMEIQKALKIIPEAVTNDKEAMLSLKKEASIMVKLNHPNIVRVYDFHYNNEIKYIDMEYVDGISLADLKLEKKDNKFPEDEIKNYAIQIAEGLAYAHNERVIHKDIKPQNVMLTRGGAIKLMDFGIAETVHSSMSRLKNTGSSGTLVYMSPEQLRGKDVGKESDIYSVGATLYELLTGNPPFYQGDITFQIINEAPKPITGVSQQMNDIVIKCLNKERGQRFKNCEEFIKSFKSTELPEREDNKTNTDISSTPELLSESQKKENNNLNQFIGNRKSSLKRFNFLTFIFIIAKAFIFYWGFVALGKYFNQYHPSRVMAYMILIFGSLSFLLVINFIENLLKYKKGPKRTRKTIVKSFVELGLLVCAIVLVIILLTTKLFSKNWAETTIDVLFVIIWFVLLTTVAFIKYKRGQKVRLENIRRIQSAWSGKSKAQKRKIKIYIAAVFGIIFMGIGLYINSLRIREFKADKKTLPFYGGPVKLSWKSTTKKVTISVTPYIPDFPAQVQIAADSTTINFPPFHSGNISCAYSSDYSVFNIKIGTGRMGELFGLSKTLTVKVMPLKSHALKGARYGFNQPVAMAVDSNNNVWIANYKGKSVTMIPRGDTSAYPVILDNKRYDISWPDAIAVDKYNNIWIGGGDGITIIPDGNPAAKPVLLKGERYGYPAAIAVDKHNNIWLAEYEKVVMIPKGDTSAKPIILKKQYYRFGDAEAIVADKQNYIWSVNKKGNSVTMFSGNNMRLSPVVLDAKFAGFDTPNAIAIDTNNNVWITNYSGKNVTLIPNGNPWKKPIILKDEKFNFYGPSAITIDSKNNVWIADYLGNHITLIPNGNPSADPISIFQNSYNIYPNAIVADKHNNIWVANQAGGVVVFEVGGEK